MYDPWGIGEAVQHGMRMFSHAKRATGRSTVLVNSVQNNDTIVFAQRAEADRIRRLLAEQGKNEVYTIVLDPHIGMGASLARIAEQYNVRGTLHFDHSWFEALYLYEIQGVMSIMDRFNKDMHTRRADVLEDEKRFRNPTRRWDGESAAEAIGGGQWET